MVGEAEFHEHLCDELRGADYRWAFARGDVCAASFRGGELVGYAFFSSLPTRVRDGIAFMFPSDCVYSYASTTARSHRGRGLSRDVWKTARRYRVSVEGRDPKSIWYVDVGNLFYSVPTIAWCVPLSPGSLAMPKSFSLEDVFFVTLLLIATLGFLWIVQDFLEPVFWAALLASLFHPMHRQLMARLDDRATLSALLVLLLILVIVILPLLFVGLAVAREAQALYQRITSGEVDLKVPLQWSSKAMPIASDLLARIGIEADRISDWLSTAAVTASRFLATRAISIGQNTLSILVQFFLMIYLVFFFLRDGAVLLDRLVRVLPLGNQRERRLFRKFAEVSRATLKGTIVVSIVQGGLGGLSLALVGIDGAVFWGVVMTILAILPAVGISIVWLPAAIWLFATGAVASGAVLIVLGTLIGFVDNLLRPILVGRDTKMPDYLILLSTLGGITAFGLSGFIIGPIIAALCLAGWDMFADDFGEIDATP